MGSFCNYLENKWLDHLLSAAYTAPTGLTFHLSTVDPGEDGSGMAEPTGNGYAAVDLDTTSCFDTAAANRIISNDADIEFPQASGGNWGLISHWAIKDQASNFLFYGAFAVAKNVNDGQTPKVLIGEVDISIPASNGMTTYLANEMLDHTFDICLTGDTTFAQPTIHLGMGTAAFGDAGAFTNEVANSGAYARKAHSAWTISTNTAENNGAITFTTATGSWGTVSDWFLGDNAGYGLGNMLLYGTWASSSAIVADDQANVPTGDLDITQD